MPKIVISYRRADMPGMAGRISDRLRQHYGDESVFMDVLSMKPGKDFRRQILKALHNCDALIAVIGPNWIGGSKRGHSRITAENDPIRMELETAFELDVPVVPIRIDGAQMPRPDELPPSLRELAFRHALDVEAGRDFHRDVDLLIEAIDELIGQSKPAAGPLPAAAAQTVLGRATTPQTAQFQVLASPPPRSGARSLVSWAIGGTALVATLAALVIYEFAFRARVTAFDGPKDFPQSTVAQTPAQFTLTPSMTQTMPLRAIAFAPNNSTFAFAGDDGIIRLWDSISFVPARIFPAQNAAQVRALAFSGDGKYLFSTGSDHTVRMWDVATALLVRTLEDAPGMADSGFLSLAVTSNDNSSWSPVRWVRAGGEDGAIRIWDLDNNERNRPKVSSQQYRKVHTLSFTPYDSGQNDKWAAAGGGGNIGIYSFSDNPTTTLKADSKAIFQIKFSKTGTALASAGYDGVKLWNVGGTISSTPLRVFDAVQSGYVLKLDWSDDQRLLASGGQGGQIVLWNAEDGTPIRVFNGPDRHTGDIEALAFHPNKKWLFSISEDKTLKAWDVETQKLLFTLVSYSDGPYLAFTPNGRYTNSPDLKKPLAKTTDGIAQQMTPADRQRFYVPPEKFAQVVDGR